MRTLAVLLLATATIVYPSQQSEKSGPAGVNSELKANATKSHSDTVPTRTAAGYVLGAGDQISIHVVNFEEINDKPIPIDLSGRIHLPLVGELQVSGITI